MLFPPWNAWPVQVPRWGQQLNRLQVPHVRVQTSTFASTSPGFPRSQLGHVCENPDGSVVGEDHSYEKTRARPWKEGKTETETHTGHAPEISARSLSASPDTHAHALGPRLGQPSSARGTPAPERRALPAESDGSRSLSMLEPAPGGHGQSGQASTRSRRRTLFRRVRHPGRARHGHPDLSPTSAQAQTGATRTVSPGALKIHSKKQMKPERKAAE